MAELFQQSVKRDALWLQCSIIGQDMGQLGAIEQPQNVTPYPGAVTLK